MTSRRRVPGPILIVIATLLAVGCRGVLDIDGDYSVEPEADAPVPPIIDSGKPDTGPPACEVSSCEPPPNDCQLVMCGGAGECEFEALSAGEPCNSDDGIVCDGMGACVSCRQNGMKDDTETDVDCGGPNCPGCATELACLEASDCESGVCHETGQCDAPKCNDNVKNGKEGAVDCGGDCIKPCAQGGGCEDAEDCETGFCTDGVCCGVACDGMCESCAAGTGACSLVPAGTDPDDDCSGPTNFCDTTGSCDDCSDLGKDGKETDADCGGDECAPCADGDDCLVDSDCESCLCDEGVCAAARCENGERDGCETDVDCGGPCGASCGDGQACQAKLDCASHACVLGSCVGP